MKKQKIHREPKPKKLGRHEQLSIDIMRDNAHNSSVVITSRQRVLQCEAEEIERGVIGLKAALTRIRERRAVVHAHLRGLAAVMEKR